MPRGAGHDGLKDEEAGWMAAAACRPPYHKDVDFFPKDGRGVPDAKAVCVNCVVRRDCLAYAVENHISFGVWGGMSERARRHMRPAGSRAG